MTEKKKETKKLEVEELEKRQAPFISGFAPEEPRPRTDSGFDTVNADADQGTPGDRGRGRPDAPGPRGEPNQ